MAPEDHHLLGMLLTGDRPLYLVARVIAGLGWRSDVYEQPPWPAEEKVVAEELGPYLADLLGAGLTQRGCGRGDETGSHRITDPAGRNQSRHGQLRVKRQVDASLGALLEAPDDFEPR